MYVTRLKDYHTHTHTHTNTHTGFTTHEVRHTKAQINKLARGSVYSNPSLLCIITTQQPSFLSFTVFLHPLNSHSCFLSVVTLLFSIHPLPLTTFTTFPLLSSFHFCFSHTQNKNRFFLSEFSMGCLVHSLTFKVGKKLDCLNERKFHKRFFSRGLHSTENRGLCRSFD